MSEKLLRVRVYDDDPEMVTVYEAYLGVRENSKSSRGFARRGVEGEFVRRLLVAGYRHLYGEFQPPQAMGAVARREPAPKGRGVKAPVEAQAESVPLAQVAPEEKKAPRVDMSNLLQVGRRAAVETTHGNTEAS